MNAAIKQWGNSIGVRLPKEALESSNLRMNYPAAETAGYLQNKKQKTKNFAAETAGNQTRED